MCMAISRLTAEYLLADPEMCPTKIEPQNFALIADVTLGVWWLVVGIQ